MPKAEILASNNDRPTGDHLKVAEMAIERARRMVETGKDVFLLLEQVNFPRKIAGLFPDSERQALVNRILRRIGNHRADQRFGLFLVHHHRRRSDAQCEHDCHGPDAGHEAGVAQRI